MNEALYAPLLCADGRRNLKSSGIRVNTNIEMLDRLEDEFELKTRNHAIQKAGSGMWRFEYLPGEVARSMYRGV